MEEHQPTQAHIDLADDLYHGDDVGTPETTAGKKKGAFPPFLKYLIIGCAALIVVLIGLYAVVLIKKSKAAGDDAMSGGVAIQPSVAAHVPQPQMNAPVPVYGNGGVPGGPQQAPQVTPSLGLQAGAPTQAGQPYASNAPPAQGGAAEQSAQAAPASAPTAPIAAPAAVQPPSAAPVTAPPASAIPGAQMQGSGQAQGIDAQSAQTLRDWPRERDEIMKRLSVMDARLEELSRTLKSVSDNRASSQPKPEPKSDTKPVRKDPPATKASAKDGEAEHKREVAAGVVRGVPRGAATKPAAQQAKSSAEPMARRDYYLTGWVGDMAFYTRPGATGREEREDSVKPGDMIDGMKVMRIDTQSRRIVLEGNQYIGTRGRQ
ncbi:hypothetical protein [Cupriavidus sp. TMH.W2]|uniref:hypothetical protein n=1 Tax=Cupriavidus sp. TMH.W2 TaxID=3434465 RepID=UPI003D782E14